MNTTSLTILVYLALTGACGVSLWLFIAARRELHRLRRGDSAKPSPSLAQEVLRLRSAGLDATRIACKLGVAPAEVRFLLDLEQARDQRTTTLAAA